MDEQAHRHEAEPPRDPAPSYDPAPSHDPAPPRDPAPPTAPPAAQIPPPPPEAWAQPVRIEPVAGTPYGLAILGAPATTSGPAVGALVAGIASILVALVVSCFGLLGAEAGWGVWVAGAFAVLAGSLGAAAVGLGIAGIRQTRQRPARDGRAANGLSPSGRGMAVTGLACGATGLAVTGCVLVVAAAIQVT